MGVGDGTRRGGVGWGKRNRVAETRGDWERRQGVEGVGMGEGSHRVGEGCGWGKGGRVGEGEGMGKGDRVGEGEEMGEGRHRVGERMGDGRQ